MKKVQSLPIIFLILMLFTHQNISGQCTINFENDGDMLFGDIEPNSPDIVNFDNPIFDAGCFNVLDENVCTCPLVGGGGMDDVCLAFEMEPIFDAYGGITTPYDGGTGHQITHEGTGIRGTIKMNTVATGTSPGDVLCYNVDVDFAPHLHQLAADVCVNTTSINTAGEVWESTSIIFWDDNDMPYGTTTYNGFYVDADGAGGDHPGTVDACTDIPAINPTPYTVSGPGVWTASCTTNTNLVPDSCNPVAASDCPDNDADPNAATDAGLDPCALVGGFTFRVCLEDVTTTATNGIDMNDGDGMPTTSSTQFTSTLNGFKVNLVCCPETQPIPDAVASTCTVATEVADWKSPIEAVDGTGAVVSAAVAPAITTIMYSETCDIVDGEYSTNEYNALTFAPEPDGVYSGDGCADEVEMTCAYVICDKGENAACLDAPRYEISRVSMLSLTLLAPAQTPTITIDDEVCNYTITPACPTDVLTPAIFGPETPGVDPPAVDITVMTAGGCMDVFPLDPALCPAQCLDYTATISGGGQICNSGTVDLVVTMDGGTAPYTVTLSDGTVISGYMSGDAIPVAPAMNTTYGVATVLDADGCPAMVAGTAEVMVIISCANAGSLNGGN